jgi:catechol 2,3-dioxygenase-like lactoylglutathione lyase family enzyme
MSATELATLEIKAFVPARDFARSMEFYQALGFRRASLFDGIAYFHCGESSFLLQDFYVREHADNFQMHLLVQDVEAWHRRAKEVADRFQVRIGEPQDQPWVMRDFTLFDPSGVLWRIGQNLPGPAVGLTSEP